MTRVSDGAGTTVLDHVPVQGAFPLERWRPGQRIRDQFSVALGPEKPPGEYTLYVGFWRRSPSNQRMPVTPPEIQDGRDRLQIARFIVE